MPGDGDGHGDGGGVEVGGDGPKAGHVSFVPPRGAPVSARPAGLDNKWPTKSLRQPLGPEPCDDLLPDEDGLGDHAVDALGAVHYLRHVVVNRDARDHIGLLA